MFSGIQSILVIESTDSNLSILNTQFANNTLHMTCISALLANDLQQCRVPDRINTYIDDMPAEQDDRTAAAPPPPAAAAAAANVGDDSDTVWYSVTITNSSFVDCGGQSVESVCVGYQFVVTIVNSNFTHSLVRERGTISTPAAEVLLFSNNVTITNTMFHGFSTVFENLASVYAKPAALVCLPPSSNRVEERPRAVPNDQASALSHMVAAPGMQVAQRPTPGNAVLSRVTFLHNHAAFGIGALRIDGYRATLTDCLFVGNSGMWGTASFYLPNRYTNASASNDAPQVDILLDHTRFLNNSGLIVSPVNIYRAQRVKISHSYFASNVARINEIFAKSGSGGALEMLLPAGFATIEHSIFTNNSAGTVMMAIAICVDVYVRRMATTDDAFFRLGLNRKLRRLDLGPEWRRHDLYRPRNVVSVERHLHSRNRHDRRSPSDDLRQRHHPRVRLCNRLRPAVGRLCLVDQGRHFDSQLELYLVQVAQ